MNKYDSGVKAALKRAEELGVYAILRLQDKKIKSIAVNNGITEEIGVLSESGIGVQIFTRDGYIGFACSDNTTEKNCVGLVERAAEIAVESARYDCKTNNAIFGVAPEKGRYYPELKYGFEHVSLDQEERILKDINNKVRALSDNISVSTSYAVSEEEWRIVRSDGTDVSFLIPKSAVYNMINTVGEDVNSTYAAISSSDMRVILDEEFTYRLHRKSSAMVKLALELKTAGKVKSGNYKLVIDYALAKGLAHEAFGHAAETDNMKTSILGKEGKFNKGKRVASDNVSIIDQSIEHDYAYQPYSANGVRRKKVEIVKDGILNDALSDVFSAEEAGCEINGAGRAMSFRNIPLPRMSNISIKVKNPIPMDMDFDDITPKILYKTILQNKLAKEDEIVLYLMGYMGGQVNTARGDFVFNCQGIYEMSKKGIVLKKPAIFSGKVLSVLDSIVAGIGNEILDVQGTCGKAGQSVASSGGSHYFLLIDRNKDIMIGGE